MNYTDIYSGLKVVAITGLYKSLIGKVDKVAIDTSDSYILVHFTPTHNFSQTHPHLMDSSLSYVRMYIDELVFFKDHDSNYSMGVDYLGNEYLYYDIVNPDYITSPSYIDEPREILLALLSSYDAYIIQNTERISEAWVPVCIDEYYNNEFQEEMDEIYYGNFNE